MVYPAHIKMSQDGGEIIQTVITHCRNTAGYARMCLSTIGLGAAAYLAGLLHDMGKCTMESKAYQEAAARGIPVQRGSVIHTFQCCRFLLEEHHERPAEISDVARELLAFAASAHHGLFDCYTPKRQSGFLHRIEAKDTNYLEARDSFLLECGGSDRIHTRLEAANCDLESVFHRLEAMSIDNQDADGSEFSFYLGLLARLLLSAVIEGDRRDTAEFLNETVFPDPPADLADLWNGRLSLAEEKILALPDDTDVQRARRRISEKCREAAEGAGGLYRLNVPTGAGKTLGSLRFALAHAAKWKKRRIIFTAPLLTILEQNAQVLREYIGDDGLVLEHHSNVVRTEEQAEQLDRQELLEENWDCPVIITTMVQLLNTLFDGRTTSIRRFWALCDSVIVIDEVQTVPNHMLSLFNLALNFLTDICGATVVLCTATQPCLERTDHPLLQTPKDIVPYDPELWKAFVRTTIMHVADRTLEEMPDLILRTLDETESLLVVCNKKSQAEYLFRQLSAIHRSCFHLSAAMCMAHRRSTLAEMEQALEKAGRGGPKVLCVSTQVIEAGVDISFQRVIRLTAGIDSMIQSAGRCNRHGESTEPAPVYVVTCADEKLGALQEIQRAKNATLALLNAFQKQPERFQHDLSSDAAVKYYFSRLYHEMPEGYQDYSVKNSPSLFSMLSRNTGYANEDSEGYGRYFLNQAFQTAGSLFQVFDDSTETVVVPYGPGAELITELAAKGAHVDPAYLMEWLRRIKPYTISIYQYQKKQLEPGGIYEMSGVLFLQPSCYDDRIGLVTEPNDNTFWEV